MTVTFAPSGRTSVARPRRFVRALRPWERTTACRTRVPRSPSMSVSSTATVRRCACGCGFGLGLGFGFVRGRGEAVVAGWPAPPQPASTATRTTRRSERGSKREGLRYPGRGGRVLPYRELAVAGQPERRAVDVAQDHVVLREARDGLPDLVQTPERGEHLRLRHVRAARRQGRRGRDVADVDLRHLQRARAVLAQVDRQQPVRALARRLADEAHRLLRERTGATVVDEPAAVDRSEER